MLTASSTSDFEKKLYELTIGDSLQYDHHSYLRVPNGWMCDAIGHPDRASVFIPYSPEGLDEKVKSLLTVLSTIHKSFKEQHYKIEEEGQDFEKEELEDLIGYLEDTLHGKI